ncbi:MAG: hypothetical protein E7009_02500 [Alphaproteobacteria bacterium]|nr:hypothetical protein [Alphaproteobacteria bacterium]
MSRLLSYISHLVILLHCAQQIPTPKHTPSVRTNRLRRLITRHRQQCALSNVFVFIRLKRHPQTIPIWHQCTLIW